MSRRTRWLLVGGVAVAALALAALLASALEPYEEERVVGYSREAARNPVLAAERFLVRMGVPARTVTGLRELPQSDAVLILADTGRPRTITETQRLVSWVGRGGLLVAGAPRRAPENVDAVDDGLMEALGIAAVPRDAGEVGPYEAAMGFSDPDETLRVALDGTLDLVAIKARQEAESEAPGPVAFASVGDGRAVVIADLAFLRNRRIGELDHAAYLWRLVNLDGRRPAAVWLVHGDLRPSLFATALRDGWPALAPAAALAAAAIARAGARLGPPMPPPVPVRRGLLEHVDAVGSLLWRRRRSEVLVEAARRAVRDRIASRHPALARLARAELAALLAARAGFGAGEAEEAMFGAWPEGAEAFTRTLETLTHLRRIL